MKSFTTYVDVRQEVVLSPMNIVDILDREMQRSLSATRTRRWIDEGWVKELGHPSGEIKAREANPSEIARYEAFRLVQSHFARMADVEKEGD